jgi:uncharacterized DUF497 family protein
MSEVSVRWDAENTRHIQVDHAERNISTTEVEEVLRSADTVKWMTKRGGRFMALGQTAEGRWLLVIYSGIYDLRPVTAWAVPDEGGSRHG